jgi:hypothetical protein
MVFDQDEELEKEFEMPEATGSEVDDDIHS